MVTNGRNNRSHGVNPNRTPGSTVPGVTRKGINSVRELLATKTHAIFWVRFDEVSSLIRMQRTLDFYPPLDLEAFL